MSTPTPTDGEHLGEKPSPRPRADLSGAFGPPNRSGGLAGRLTRPTRPASAVRTEIPTQPAPAAVPVGEGSASSAADTSTLAVAALDLLEAPAAAPARQDTGDHVPAKPQATKPAQTNGTGKRKPAKTAAPRPTPGRAAAAASTGTEEARPDSEGALVTSIVYVPGGVLERLRRARAATGLTYTQLALDALDGTHQVLGDLIAKATEPVARPASSLFSGPSSTPATVNPKVQITLRPRSSDAAIIDRLAADHGTSRSQLITLALDAHLPRS